MMDYDVLVSCLVPILGITILIIIASIGLVYLIGNIAQRVNIKKGLEKDDLNSPLSKISLGLILFFGSLVFIGVAVIFVVGSFLGWSSPI